MPRALYKVVVVAGSCLVALAGAALVFALVDFLRPESALHVHVDSIPWDSLTVESDNLPAPRLFSRTAEEIRISPISKGPYRINLRLSDGQTVWSEFFHHDAGVRRRIDVFVAPSPRAGYVHFRQTTNRSEQLFDGETRPGDTTAEKPFILDSI